LTLGNARLADRTVVTMTTTDDVTPIRVSGPAGLLAVQTTMQEFNPTYSLVLMCMTGGRLRVGPVARVDLPPGHDRPLAAQLTSHALHHADEVVVISYQESRRRPPLLDDLLGTLARAGVDVLDAMVVRGGRARPALNAAIERAHPGSPVPDSDDPQVSALAAAGALAGRGVLADREQLRRSIAGPTGHRLRLALRCVDDAAAGRLPTPDGTAGMPHSWRPTFDRAQPGPAAALATAERDPELSEHVLCIGPLPPDVAAILELAFAQVSVDGAVEVETATALAVLMTDVPIRDAVLAKGLTELHRPWMPMLISCATWTPDPLAPALCSVLAMVAYRHGDGALAQVAIDRCLLAEPEHGLAQLMIAIMSAGIHPDELDRIAHDEVSIDELDPDWS
jgi:hypothetical protein